MFSLKTLVWVSTLILLIACRKEPDTGVSNLNGNEISVFGHGGMGIKSTFPINSLKSIKKCLEKGADGTEIDVQLSEDGELVAYHALDLKKQTNCEGLMYEQTWQEICGCVYADLKTAKIKVVRVEDIFNEINNLKNYIFTFDVKLYNGQADVQTYQEEMSAALIKLIETYDLWDNIYLESTDRQFLQLMADAVPQSKLFYYSNDFDSSLDFVLQEGLFGLTMAYDDISFDQVKEAHNAGIRIALWNTNTRDKNDIAIEKDPDYIQTDNLKYLLRTLN
ncbi:MAG: hypothetical protein IH946_09870 [Bacteroidetes bacterium]|nr:hypothetical protein [Bacteroidota bacterium]